MAKHRPTADRVLIKRKNEDAVSKGGILIPESAQKPSMKAVVVAVGPGKLLDCGVRAVPEVKEGDTVLITQWRGEEVDVDGDKCVVVREEEIMAVLEED